MATIGRSHRIHVSSSSSSSGRRWTVFVAGRRDAIFTGARAKERAVECALRRAEVLRTSGPALVIIEPSDCGEHVSHVESQLAS